MFDMEGVEIDFREDGLRAVATKAMERKTGARGLRSILENVLLESMYNIPSQTGVAKIVVDESVINGDSEPLLVTKLGMRLKPPKTLKPDFGGA
jgi:ATP-dependent Clp protease ATP-binding subunit ClpX